MQFLNNILYNLSNDKLFIYDGYNSSAPTIQGSGGFLTGLLTHHGEPNMPTTFTSTGQDIFLKFTSDASGTLTGFLIEYEQGINVCF